MPATALPIIDLHCDLLSYLVHPQGGRTSDVDRIGCAIPHLKRGNVKLQVCALFAMTEPGSSEKGLRQAEAMQKLIYEGAVGAWISTADWEEISQKEDVYVLPAFESASVHTSDALARDILDHLEKHKLDIPLIASHSNFRAITDHPHNLPSDLVQALKAKNGIQGINFIKEFLGLGGAESLYRQFAHGRKAGARMAFGADFFPWELMPPEFARPGGYFF